MATSLGAAAAVMRHSRLLTGQLLVQVHDALSEFTQRQTRHGVQAVVVGLDPEIGAGRQQVRAVQRPQPRPKGPPVR